MVTALAETVILELPADAPAVATVSVVDVVPAGTGFGEKVHVTLVGRLVQLNWMLSTKLVEGAIVTVDIPEVGMLSSKLDGLRLKLKSTTCSITGLSLGT